MAKDDLKSSTDLLIQQKLITAEINDNYKRLSELQKESNGGNEDAKIAYDELLKRQKILVEQEQKYNNVIKESNKSRENTIKLIKGTNDLFKIGWGYLQQQDKIIRSTILSLGMSGAKAEMMRGSFEKSAGFVTRMGGSLADTQSIMQGYADETGRARVMSAQMVEDITSIGKGTGLGIEQATKLGAQFEIMGFDAKSTMNYVQGVVDTSERMGVNTTKVLKNVSDNFKKLNTYTFQQGVKGFAQMAMYAEKFKINISDALNAADVSRTLEGAIDLTAQLQVMGGEFAKTDPFQMLFLSRNDPAKFTEKISDMTKGIVTFRKMSDGSFEKFISPADRDRLAAVAKSLGMSKESITEIAERRADMEKINRQLAGTGLTGREKELIQGAAIFNKQSGRFQVELAGTMTDISTLTEKQAKSFAKEQVLLQDRAKNAMTFDETFKATIETLKSALLPLLRGINIILKPLSGLADQFSKLAGKGGGGIAAAAGILLAAAGAWRITSNLIITGANKWAESGKLLGGRGSVGKFLSNNKSTTSGGSLFTPKGGIRKGAAELTKAKGIKNLATGGGIGAAALGIGGGIALAATGISKLADSMSKLDKTGLNALPKVILSLAGAIAAFVIPLAILGTTATVGAAGLAALGVVALGIGAGIGIAAAGIGYMSEGLSKLVIAGKDAGPSMFTLAGGIGAISLAMMGMTTGVVGVAAFSLLLNRIAKHAPDLEKVGDAFKQINTMMSGSKDDFIAVENAVKSISGMNIKGGGMLAELSNLLKSPLKVEFANNGKVLLSNDITLNLDGDKFMHKVYNTVIAIEKNEFAKGGKSSK